MSEVQNELVEVQCKPCMVCGEAGSVVMPIEAYDRWAAGEFIQQAWPLGSAAEREMLISGTHGACWDRMWAGISDD